MPNAVSFLHKKRALILVETHFVPKVVGIAHKTPAFSLDATEKAVCLVGFDTKSRALSGFLHKMPGLELDSTQNLRA